MTIGDPAVFAIESGISRPYECLSLRALGFFVIRILGRGYGVRGPESSMLACSFDEVERRIRERGQHAAPFVDKSDAGEIADAFRLALYAEDEPGGALFEMDRKEFSELVYSRDLIWAPDGDEAFDDGSYVLQFDIKNGVRLIAFRCGQDGAHDPRSLSDLTLPADEYYGVLEQWREAFQAEWRAMPREPVSRKQVNKGT